MPGVFRAYPPSLQAVAVLSGFVLKPAYMALALVLIRCLRGRREPDLWALGLSLWAFFIGECFCYVNIFAYHHGALWPELLHSAGMAAALGLAVLAALEGATLRVPREPCPLSGLCRSCTRPKGLDCRLSSLAPYGLTACLIMTALPPLASLSAVSYQTLIGRFPFDCTHPVGAQLLEFRAFPALAACLLAAALAARPRPAWKGLFSAGMGLLLFSYLRLTLFEPFRHALVWFDFWEETTELLGLCALALALWTFREGLLGGET